MQEPEPDQHLSNASFEGTTRRLSFTLSRAPPEESPSVPPITDSTNPVDSSTEVQEAQHSQWTEPEAGFEAISLNDPNEPSSFSPSSTRNDLRRESDGSVNSNTQNELASTSEIASTAPTTHAPTSPSSSSISSSKPPAPSSTTSQRQRNGSTSMTPQTSEEGAGGGGAQGMSQPPDSSKVEQPSPAKQQQNASRPSVMQKIISMTRQRDLPPKNREEEEKHLKQLADMLAASKEAEKRKRLESEQKAAARASALASALPTWESQILPNWRAVLHDTSEGRYLRKLWWQGTMPVRFRGRLWSLCIGNGLAIPKNSYAISLQRAKKGLEGGNERLEEFRREAEEEMENVLPSLKLFQKKGGVMHDDLLDLLLAWAVHDLDRPIPKYPRGLAYPASLLLVNMPPPEAFISLLNLIHKSFLKSFYSSNSSSLSSYERVFDTLLADSMPKVYSNFSSSVVRPSLYLVPWLTTLFIGYLELELSTRLFDIFLLEGDSFAFRTSLVLLKILEPRLFNPNLEELENVFKGKDQGAVAIVKREKGLLTIGGDSTEREEGKGASGVEVEEVYTEMGCTEDRVFGLLEEMEWKEETWDRLVERELPDAD
ncbi:uncharacterized protein JCM6883_005474 [Sporobolomyces salmoneus]|uniref:uncharacterized protein n=1 Tax=Sporobolomyces salmoneus TaxID=183962 RepID=UPI00317E2524